MEGDITNYEWVIEVIDENEDVIDPLFYDKLKDAIDNGILPTVEEGQSWYPDYKVIRVDVGLKRDLWRCDDLEHREYIYVEDGVLPEEFDNGWRVPQKYMKEFNRVVSKVKKNE